MPIACHSYRVWLVLFYQGGLAGGPRTQLVFATEAAAQKEADRLNAVNTRHRALVTWAFTAVQGD